MCLTVAPLLTVRTNLNDLLSSWRHVTSHESKKMMHDLVAHLVTKCRFSDPLSLSRQIGQKFSWQVLPVQVQARAPQRVVPRALQQEEALAQEVVAAAAGSEVVAVSVRGQIAQPPPHQPPKECL